MRLGIFGGSFDPIHHGHLRLAQCCCLQAELDEIWFVPTAQQPLKPEGPQASNRHRLAMLELACAEDPKFKVSTVEFDRGGVSYSIDTLEAIRAEQATAELFFMMGADTLADFPAWHRPADICRLATPLVVRRGATAVPRFELLREFVAAERLDQIRHRQVDMPPTPISSSQIRQLIAIEGATDGATGHLTGDWQELLPARVARYIREHRLYASNLAAD